jgi:adenosylmethionine-8-amino-7-oxononanoate aminotransferase
MNGEPSHDELREWDLRHHWHAFTQMAEYEPLIIQRAEGCRLFDIEGRSYLDGASSMWCNVHGHNHPRINGAIAEQLGRVAHCTALGMGSDTTVRLAKRLAEVAPGDLEHVFFSSAEDGISVLAAVRTAAAKEIEVPRTRRSISRRHAGERERERHCAISCDFQTTAV